MNKKKLFVCTSCGYVGKPKSYIKGSFIIELILWGLGIIFLFIFGFITLIPGFIYTLWRVSTKYKGCRNCKSNSIIPVDSPKGQLLLKELNVNIDDYMRKK